MTGGAAPSFDNASYLTSRNSSDREYCLAYMMREEDVYPPGTDIEDMLDLFTQVRGCVCVRV